MKKIFILILILIIDSFAVDASMEIIKKSNQLPTISVSHSQNNTTKLMKDIKHLIEKDLEVSGHFRVASNEYLFESNENPDNVLLSRENIDLVLNLELEKTSINSLKINIKLYDVNNKKLVLNKFFTSSRLDRFPFVSHRISIDVNKYLKAPSIDWMDKFVIFSVYTDSKEADIYISDYTLTFQKRILRGGLNIFPKWANKKQDSFYYTTLTNGVPTLYKKSLYSNKKTKIIQSDGMVICSDVNESGDKILITASPNGQPDIYMYDLNKKRQTKITSYKGIDVGAQFVEDDKKVVFVSDRLSKPNIFSKRIGSSGVERLVYHGKNNSAASTYKNYIVYASRDVDNEFDPKSFNLYLISTTSDFITKLTQSGVNQFPKFSSNGESILFIKTQNNSSSIGIIRINYNRTHIFPLKGKKIQSIDW